MHVVCTVDALLTDDESDLGNADAENDAQTYGPCSLQYVIGDATHPGEVAANTTAASEESAADDAAVDSPAPHHGPSSTKITLNVVDASGRWGTGGMFSALDTMLVVVALALHRYTVARFTACLVSMNCVGRLRILWVGFSLSVGSTGRHVASPRAMP
jgi:hypothetical protein